MGTSTNPRSPNTPQWRPLRAVLGSGWPIERQSSEVWLAATADREGQLSDDLGAPEVAAAGQIASSGLNPVQATRAFDNVLEDSGAHGIIMDMARRALARAAAAESGVEGFATQLFTEAVSYYVSRELPSHVGRREGVSSTSAAIELKSRIKEVTRDIVRRQPAASAEPGEWKAYVSRVLATLREVPNLQ